MKLFAKLMIALLVLAILLPFTILKNETGNTMLDFSNFKLPDFSLPDISLPDLPKTPKLSPSSNNHKEKDIFYQWYDENGDIQFTTVAPPEGVEYKVKGYDPNANVIQSVTLPEIKESPDETDPVQSKPGASEDVGNPYSGDSIKKLFEDTKNIEKMLNQRYQKQEDSLNQ